MKPILLLVAAGLIAVIGFGPGRSGAAQRPSVLTAGLYAMMYNFSHAASRIISPAATAKGEPYLARHAVGTGPFRFVRWTPGVEIVLERNPAYWQSGQPKIDRIVFKPVTEDGSRVALLLSGEAQFIFFVPGALADSLAKSPGVSLLKRWSDYAFYGWAPATLDADWGLRPLFAGDSWPPTLFNIGFYKDARVDALLAAGLSTADQAARNRDYAQVLGRIWNTAPSIFLYNSESIAGQRAAITGAILQPDGKVDVRWVRVVSR